MAKQRGNMGRRIGALKQTAKVSVVTAMGVTIAALYFAQDVLIPLVLSVLMSFLLAPLCDRLERWRLGRTVSVLIVVSVATIFVGGLGWIVGKQVVKLAADVPAYEDNIIEKVRSLRGSGGGIGSKFEHLGKEIEKATSTTQPATTQAAEFGASPRNVPDRPEAVGIPEKGPPGSTAANPIFTRDVAEPTSPWKVLGGYVGLVLGPLGTAGIVIVITLFMLLEREDLRDRMLRLVSRGKYTVTTIALDDAAQRISRYLVAQLIVNGSYGLAVTLGLWLIGLYGGEGFPSFVLWGLLCALLRFIPYIGPWVAAAFPIMLSIVAFPGFTIFMATTIMFVVIELISNNLIEPWLYGSSTGMSTVAVLVSAVFWTWLWGPVGLFLATPLTVCLVVIGRYVKQFQFLDVLLGDQPALEPSVNYYQRLLANDRDEAARVIEGHIAAHGIEKVPDDVMIPALRMARRDRKDGDLSADTENCVYDGTAEILRSVMHHADAEDKKGQPLILGAPAHHSSEELVLEMLRQVVPHARVEVLSTRQLPSEIEERIEAEKPAVLYVAIVPPGGLTQARYLCRRLRRRFPDLQIVVGYWGRSRDFDKLLARFRSAGVRSVATSLLQSRSHVEALLPKVEPPKDEPAAPSRPVPAQDNPAAPPEGSEPLGNT